MGNVGATVDRERLHEVFGVEESNQQKHRPKRVYTSLSKEALDSLASRNVARKRWYRQGERARGLDSSYTRCPL
jgi:hypothetical protein